MFECAASVPSAHCSRGGWLCSRSWSRAHVVTCEVDPSFTTRKHAVTRGCWRRAVATRASTLRGWRRWWRGSSAPRRWRCGDVPRGGHVRVAMLCAAECGAGSGRCAAGGRCSRRRRGLCWREAAWNEVLGVTAWHAARCHVRRVMTTRRRSRSVRMVSRSTLRGCARGPRAHSTSPTRVWGVRIWCLLVGWSASRRR